MTVDPRTTPCAAVRELPSNEFTAVHARCRNCPIAANIESPVGI
jgi:hypothetical protein